ncbi:MAG: hypothetical protein LUF87_06990 [Alistipes sp.]|nr:hypothetical protein [Alistipes sp.]
MQEYRTLLDNFKKILSMRIGSEKEMTEKIAAVLGRDAKSVKRRLRGEYKFSLDEIFNICAELGISLESLAEKNPGSVSSLRVYQFPEPLSLSKCYISNLFTILEQASNCPQSSYTIICNRLPEALHIRYDNISQLLLLKLGYFTKETIEPDAFRQLVDSWPAFEELKDSYLNLIDSFNSLTFLWGTDIIRNVVRDVRFFLDVDMITREDADGIKGQMIEMIGYLNRLCNNPAPYQTFTFAVSPVDMNFHSNTLRSSTVNRTDFFLYHHAFCGSENEQDLRSQKIIADRLMNGAIILSGSNHTQRNKFFKKQLEIIETI